MQRQVLLKFVLSLGFMIGCATAPVTKPEVASPTKSAVDSSATVDAADRVSEELFKSLQQNDFVAAEHDFDATMKEALPPERLREVWVQVTGSAGALKSWRISERGELNGRDRRAVDLAFENAPLRGLVFVNPATKEISGFRIVPAPVASALPPVLSDEFRSEAVSVGSSPTQLGATLNVPKAGNGPFPAVVLVAGSGPHDRDETIGPNKPFKDLAEGLATKGVVVLRYDKRTFAHPDKIDAQHVTVEDEVIADAVAAVEYLRHRPEVAEGRIFVVGHSLGALLAPEIAQRARPVAGVVLLAASGRPLPQLVVEQMRYLGALPAEKLNELEKQAKLLMEGKMPANEPFMSVPASYWIDLGKRDEMGIAKKLARPILYLRGDRDYQVTETDQRAWEKALSGTANVTFQTLPSLNHLFIKGSGKPGPTEYGTAGHVEPVVIDRLLAFVVGT